MTRWPWICLLVGMMPPAAALGAEPQATFWGGVAGRVVLEGDLNSPRVRAWRDDVEIRAPRTQQQAQAGIQTPLLRTVPNTALVIDPATRGVANVFIYLKARPGRTDPALERDKPKPVAIKCENDMLTPRALIVRTGQTVELSAQAKAAAFKIDPLLNPPLNPLVQPGTPYRWVPLEREALPIPVRDNLRPWARSNVLIVDHPYAVLSGFDGTFQLNNLPSGQHDLTIWHETIGYVAKRLTCTVQAGKVQELPPIRITVDRLR